MKRQEWGRKFSVKLAWFQKTSKVYFTFIIKPFIFFIKCLMITNNIESLCPSSSGTRLFYQTCCSSRPSACGRAVYGTLENSDLFSNAKFTGTDQKMCTRASHSVWTSLWPVSLVAVCRIPSANTSSRRWELWGLSLCLLALEFFFYFS